MSIYLRERKLIYTLVAVEVVRVILFAVTTSSVDFWTWIAWGEQLYNGSGFYGVYTGPVYIFAAEYALWLALTHIPNPPLYPLSLETAAFTLSMKIGLFITDIATVLLIIRIVRTATDSPKKALWAGMLWMTSPFVFLLENHNAVEIYPAFLVLLGSWAIYRSKIKSGALSMAIGTLLRFAPLLVAWIYLVAFARLRQFKNLAIFLGIQLTLFACGILFLDYSLGLDFLQLLLTPNLGVGLFIPEIVRSVSATVKQGIVYNPVQLSLGIIIFMLIGYLTTRPSVWKGRIFGVEALAFFAAYFALVFQDPYILWMLPLLFIYAFITRYGPFRLLCTTIVGFLYVTIADSDLYTYYGNALFLIPNLNGTMSTLSSTILRLGGEGIFHGILVWILRSIFSAFLLMTVIWILRDSSKNSLDQKTIL